MDDLTLRLSSCLPYDSAGLLTFFARRAVPGVEEVIDGRYRRTLALAGWTSIVELEPAVGGEAVWLRARNVPAAVADDLTARCRALFDLDADPVAIAAILGRDPLLAPLVAARPGLRRPGAVDGFELAVRAVLGQQVSVAGARTLAGRLVQRAGTPLPTPDGALTHAFPTAAAVAAADLTGLGLPGARAAALQGLARAVAAGDITLARGADTDAVSARLVALPGIGPWTAAYIAMRGLGDADAFPAADLGLRRALERRGLAADPARLLARAEDWRPFRAYAVLHLWASDE